MPFIRTGLVVTRQQFKNGIEGFLISGEGEYCMAEVATANGYLDYVQHWRNEVDRILFVELVFFIQRETKAPFEKRKAIAEVIAEYNTGEGFRKMLLFARKALAVRYLKQPHADLKLPDAETGRNAFWLMVSEVVSLALEEP